MAMKAVEDGRAADGRVERLPLVHDGVAHSDIDADAPE